MSLQPRHRDTAVPADWMSPYGPHFVRDKKLKGPQRGALSTETETASAGCRKPSVMQTSPQGEFDQQEIKTGPIGPAGDLDNEPPGRPLPQHLTDRVTIIASTFRTDVLKEKAKHFLGRIGSFRVCKRPVRATAGPGMASSVNNPLLEDASSAYIALD